MAVINIAKARNRHGGPQSSSVAAADSTATIAAAAAESTPHEHRVTDDDSLMEQRQLSLLYEQASIAVWGSIATAIMIVMVLWPVTPYQLLLRWSVLFVMATAIRALLMHRYFKQQDKTGAAEEWFSRFDGTLFLSGTVWGLAGILLPPSDSAIYNALVSFCIVALVAGAVVTFSAHLRSVFAFSLPAIVPYSVYLLLQGNLPMVVLGFAFLIYLGFITSIAFRMRQGFIRDFAAQRENMHLIKQLAEQKDAVTTLNAELETRVSGRTAHLEKEIAIRRATESELRLYEEILDTSVDLSSVVDKDYIYLAVNHAYVQAFGKPKESFIGKAIADITGANTFENQLKPLIDRALLGESVVSEYWIDYSILGQRYVEARYEPFNDVEGSIAGVTINAHNITERKRAEDELRESAEAYRAIFDDAPLGIGLVDLRGGLIRANPAFYEIFGYDWDEDDLTGTTISDFTHPDDRQVTGVYMGEVRAGQSDMVQTEKRYLRKDGSVMWGQINVSLVRDANGEAVHTVGQVQDISARKKVEEELNKSAVRYRLSEEVGQLGYWEWDERADKLISCSEQYARIFGMTVDEVMTRFSNYEESLSVIHPDDREQYDRANRAALTEQSDVDIEYRVITSTAAVRHVLEVRRGDYDEDGQAIRTLGTLQDITARKNVENELRRSHALYEQAAQLGRLGHWEWDLATDRLIACSEQYAEILEMDVESAIEASTSTQRNLELKHPDDRERYHQADLATSGNNEGLEIQYRIITGSGAIRWINEIAETEFDANGSPVRMFGTLQDITAQKQAEQALAESAKLAATGRMVARIAHEINNPLAGIKNSFLLLKGAIPEDYEYYPYVGRIDRELERVSTIVHQMLDQYRGIEHQERDIELAQIVDDVVLLLEPMCREHEISVIVRRPDGVVVRVLDSVVRQALFNVLGNAIKFSVPGDEVTVEAHVSAQAVTISVTDHGPGIAPEEAERIFEAFYSGGETNSPGLGLGLSVSRSLLEHTGGSLTFHSTPGVATTFVIETPLRGEKANFRDRGDT